MSATVGAHHVARLAGDQDGDGDVAGQRQHACTGIVRQDGYGAALDSLGHEVGAVPRAPGRAT